MTTRPPASIGMVLADVDTPALLIDLDAFERNLQRMAEFGAKHNVRLRPHAKTHKCAAIALQQMALGAVGVCCQKVSEAEALVYAGVSDVLVSNQVVGETKIARLVALAKQAQIAVCVDDVDNIADLNKAAQAASITLDVLVEIDVGAGRCGVEPGQAALVLTQQIEAASNLTFKGLQAYQGKAQHLRTYAKRQQAIKQAVEWSQHTADLLVENGVDCPIISGAGTGTYTLEASSGVYNELQAGSYIFMDADYALNLNQTGDSIDDFEHSLFIHTTVMSTAKAGQAVVDAGLKSLSVDSGLPKVHNLPTVTYAGASDEHGVLTLAEGHNALQLGTKLQLIPGHCDPTVNLYDWYVGIRNERVETLWPVTARGAVL